jgi:pimeloyl-ACP methyl ester carboxylesterase
MAEQERLRAYYPNFDEPVLDRVAEVAEQLRNSTWQAINDTLPDNKIFEPISGKPIEVLDVLPQDDYDKTYVYHLPMGNPLADHMRLRMATLSLAAPDKRIIAVGNPSGPKQGIGRLKFADIPSVWNGDLRATVDPILQYLEMQHIDPSTHIGYSYGAEKAATASIYADRYDQEVEQGIFIEPVSLKTRGLIELASDFNSTAAALGGYIGAAKTNAVYVANNRASEKSHGMLGYVVGLARLSNIAIAHALAKDYFERRTQTALENQHDMRANLIWGSESELAVNSLMVAVSQRLVDRFGPERVSPMVLEGQKHAMGDDVFLHTAMVLQVTK